MAGRQTGGYYDSEQHKANQVRYPNLAALDEKVSRLLASPAAKKWSIPRKEYEISRIHPVYWMEEYGWIKQAEVDGESGEVGIVPFRLNPVQLQIADKICKGLVPDKWQRVQALVLKYRKAGISTLMSAFDYWLMRFIKNFNMFVIADLGSHTDNLVEMVKLFHSRDTCGFACTEADYQPPMKIPMPRSKKGFRLSNGSMLEQDTGENSNPGTSATLQGCHMSENSKWRDPESAETSLLNSIPRTGFIFVVKESTAKGINKFANDCEQAEKGNTNWDFVFISWKDVSDCEAEMIVGEELDYTDKERELIALYKLRPGHIKFRRSQIQFLGSESSFVQDYPLNSREPFLLTGHSFFPLEKVQERISEIRFFRDWKTQNEDYMKRVYPDLLERVKHHPGGEREALARIDDRNVLPMMYTLHTNEDMVTHVHERNALASDGALTVFRLPQVESRYVVIVDVAEGINNTEYTSDNSIIEVLDTRRREQVAEWGGLFDEEVTAHYAVLIAKMYNNADIIPEMNNKCGGILLEKLMTSGYRKIFQRQTLSGQQVKSEPGWRTTVGNKSEVCGQYRLDFKNDDCWVHSLYLLEEMLFFVDNRGKLGASSGHTDDRVMTLSVGCKVIAETPMYRNFNFANPRTGRKMTTLPTYVGQATRIDQERKAKRLEQIRRYR